MRIPLLDLTAQYDFIKTEVDEAVQNVLDTQHFIMGEPVKKFESKVNGYIGSNYAFGCASGSDALLLALMAIDIQPGDYVITSPFTFFATAGAISRLGAIPIFIDVEYDSFNIDPEKVRAFLEGEDELAKKINAPKEKIKAIIPVHLYGQVADMDPIMNIAKEYNLFVIEDAAQSIGSKYKDHSAGTMGDFGCFSFFPSKNLGAYGDAGLITVKDEGLAEKVDMLRLHGARPKYHHKYVGINSRLDTIQAAILEVKLKYLEEWSTRRREIALLYNELFEEAGLIREGITLPKETTGNPETSGVHIYHQYTVRINHRDELAKHLKEKGIGHAVYYPIPLHEQECFAGLGYQSMDCPIAYEAGRQVISLPIYPELTEEKIQYVVKTISEFIRG